MAISTLAVADLCPGGSLVALVECIDTWISLIVLAAVALVTVIIVPWWVWGLLFDRQQRRVPVKYREIRKWKYELRGKEDFAVPGKLFAPLGTVKHGRDLYEIANDSLVVRPGYAWDGASGPTIDSPSSMRATLLHDVVYQICRTHAMEPGQRKEIRRWADREFRHLLRLGGMWAWRRWLWWLGVRCAARAAEPRPGLVED